MPRRRLRGRASHAAPRRRTGRSVRPLARSRRAALTRRRAAPWPAAQDVQRESLCDVAAPGGPPSVPLPIRSTISMASQVASEEGRTWLEHVARSTHSTRQGADPLTNLSGTGTPTSSD
eukprot:2304762-Pyramimonas_sp.AAC.1